MQKHWQGYDESGSPGGAVSLDMAAAGALHGSVHVWLWRRAHDGTEEVLFQKRSADMKTWPGCWDCSAAGHIDYSEQPMQAALREAPEEIGVDFKETDLRLICVFRDQLDYAPANIKENELQWLYTAEPSEDFLVIPHDTSYAQELLRGLKGKD